MTQHLLIFPDSAIYKVLHGRMNNIHEDIRRFSKLWFNRNRETKLYLRNKVGVDYMQLYKNDLIEFEYRNDVGCILRTKLDKKSKTFSVQLGDDELKCYTGLPTG